MLGKNTLFPFAFHCTGMPIAAAAKKLKQEFDDPTKVFIGKKTSEILEEVGVPKEIIPEFVKPERWL